MKLAVFTIATAKDLAEAKVLLDSVKELIPNAEPILVLAEDAVTGSQVSVKKFGHSILTLEQLRISSLQHLAFQHDAIEFCSAIKPWAFRFIFERGIGSAIYFSPSVQLYSDLEDLTRCLSHATAVISSTVTNSFPDDGYFPSDIEALLCGHADPSMLALRSDDQIDGLIASWCSWMNSHVSLNDREFHTERIFLSSLPFRVDRCAVLRKDSYSVGIWNLSQRELVERDSMFFIGSEKLAFLNFSGLIAAEGAEKNRLTYGLNEPRPIISSTALRKAVQDRVSRVNHARLAIAPCPERYSFDTFNDGSSILLGHRRSFLHMGQIEKESIGNPFEARDSIAQATHVFRRRISTHDLASELASIKKGYSWRLGRAMTWPVRSMLSLRSRFTC